MSFKEYVGTLKPLKDFNEVKWGENWHVVAIN